MLTTEKLQKYGFHDKFFCTHSHIIFTLIPQSFLINTTDIFLFFERLRDYIMIKWNNDQNFSLHKGLMVYINRVFCNCFGFTKHGGQKQEGWQKRAPFTLPHFEPHSYSPSPFFPSPNLPTVFLI